MTRYQEEQIDRKLKKYMMKFITNRYELTKKSNEYSQDKPTPICVINFIHTKKLLNK